MYKYLLDTCKVLYAMLFYDKMREKIAKILGSGSILAGTAVTKGDQELGSRRSCSRYAPDEAAGDSSLGLPDWGSGQPLYQEAK